MVILVESNNGGWNVDRFQLVSDSELQTLVNEVNAGKLALIKIQLEYPGKTRYRDQAYSRKTIGNPSVDGQVSGTYKKEPIEVVPAAAQFKSFYIDGHLVEIDLAVS